MVLKIQNELSSVGTKLFQMTKTTQQNLPCEKWQQEFGGVQIIPKNETSLKSTSRGNK